MPTRGIPACGLLFISLLLYSPAALPAGEEEDFRRTHLGSKQGLSESHVFAITQDRKGFIWFGTRDGLNRFDGYEMKVYRNDPKNPFSISNHYVYALYEDPDGMMWVGTRGGLNLYDPSQDSFSYFLMTGDNTGLSNETVHAITPGQGPTNGWLWLGTFGGGVNLFNPATGLFTHYRRDPDNPRSLTYDSVRDIEVAPDGTLWVGTDDGLSKMTPDEPGIFTNFTHEPGNPNSLSQIKISGLFLDKKGILWIGNELGLDKLDTLNGDRIRSFSRF